MKGMTKMTTERSLTRLLIMGVVAAVALTPAVMAQQAPRVIPTGRIDLSLRLSGLYPKIITVEEGAYEVLFTNGSFLAPFDISIMDGNGKGVAQTAAKGKFRHRQALRTTLRPGRYQFMVVGHPNWTADLQVTPKQGR